MKVGFYLSNENVGDVDLSCPEKGNPGVGGTQFNFVTLPYYLQKHNNRTVEPTIYANVTERLPPEINVGHAENAADAARKADQDGCEVIVFRPTEATRENGVLDVLSTLDLKAVAWGHNVPLPLSHMDELFGADSVARFVVVGRERLDQIRDHPLFEKSRCVYNGFDPSPYLPEQLSRSGPPTVAYVGSLVPAKGFHRLAKAWPEIKQMVPEANMVVIGSGRLYDREADLGKWGIASEKYERRFRSYLSNNKGEVESSVRFTGTLGTEKIPLLKNAHVGVVNPTGRTENCPGSAIEFQASGTPVVSIAEWGLLDTVKNGETGILVRNHDEHELGKAVARLLHDDPKRIKYARAGIEFVRQKFSQRKICGQWNVLFRRVATGQPPKQEPIKKNLFYRDKWLREGMRLAKNRIPRLRAIPPLFSTGKRALIAELFNQLLEVR